MKLTLPFELSFASLIWGAPKYGVSPEYPAILAVLLNVYNNDVLYWLNKKI